MKNWKVVFVYNVIYSLLFAGSLSARAQGTAFSYQGRLNDGSGPANGFYDIRFMILDAPTNGNLISGPLTNSSTGITNGLFAATLDFGSNVFTGPDRWLQLDVRTNGGNAFTTLLPLQLIQPIPYAIMANSASNLLGTLPTAQLNGTIPLGQLPAAVVTNNASNLVLSGTFSGEGSGLANLPLTGLQSGGASGAQVLTWSGSAWVPANVLSANSATVLGTMTTTLQAPAFTNLYSFSGLDGANPRAGLILGQDGNFYGTTGSGGTNNQGIIFRFTTNGVLTTLYTATDGSLPYEPGPIIQEGDGIFYGTINDYPTYNGDVVFRLALGGSFSIFATPNGANPFADFVLQAADGYLYGESQGGGTNLLVQNQYAQTVGCGSLYRVNTNGAVEILFSFNGTNGNCTSGPLTQGSDGSIYGMTGCGGIGFVPGGYKSAFPDGVGSGYGTIFKWSTNGTFTTLLDFNGTNGCVPQNCGLVQGSDGSFYGTTEYGGIGFNGSSPGNQNGNGTIFKITSGGAFTTLYQFTGGNDGGVPIGTLVQAGDGNFYGTTYMGGSNNMGTVFRISPAGTFASLFSFNGTNGANLSLTRKLAIGNDGNLYGTTYSGGTSNLGTIFRMTFPPPSLNINTTIAAAGFNGDGGGLTNLNTAQLNGVISQKQLPGTVVTNTETGVALSGVFSGNGIGLTNVSLAALQSGGATNTQVLTWNGTVWTPSNAPAVGGGGNVSSNYSGVVSFTNSSNSFVGGFAGDGSGLTNLSAYVAKSGDIMTGILSLPSNGLVAGSNQLVLSHSSVGIGTVNPPSTLAVYRTIPFSVAVTNASIYMRGSDNGYGLAMGNLAGGYSWIQAMLNDAPAISLLLNPSGGNVGIGTTTPTATLDVNGSVRASGTINAVGGLIIENRTSDPPSPVPGQIWLRTDLP
jgi:uncharacterized repeat protein (TIGR03803 family)